ncbi:lecithin retinol acyltransferase family protein [Bacillus sp. FJAT-45350]|uniref:lecithin retinol acyltransferase family protein n=1 Tax=Bacillus sp. FJAT-45350 TaxID=2011014 RepID=UPI000BB8501A|nr:lecithin retinol acyltransferase family protein [Bacillus sp. FJAT-45350]
MPLPFLAVAAALAKVGTVGLGVTKAAAAATTTAVVGKQASKAVIRQNSKKKVSNQSQLQYGDIIGIKRKYYEHYGIYAGNDRVIHYTSYTSDVSSDNEIMETDFSHFLKEESSFFVLNVERIEEKERRYKNFPTSPVTAISNLVQSLLQEEDFRIYTPEETVRRARLRLGESKYSLGENNCEHFAVWCKTGLSKSYQVDQIKELAGFK